MIVRYTFRSLILALSVLAATFALLFVVSRGIPKLLKLDKFDQEHQDPDSVKDWQGLITRNQLNPPVTYRFENGLVTIIDSHYDLTNKLLQKLSVADLEIVYERIVLETTADCSTSRRFGRKVDGGWDLCLVGPLMPQDPCFSFSFGINEIWEFDDELAAEFKCNVLAFDPSMHQKTHLRSSRVRFVKEGLREAKGTFNSWSVDSYLGYLRRFKAETFVIDVLKIDIEFSEWSSLEMALRDGSLRNVKQLMLETHVLPTASVTEYLSNLAVLRELHEQGFRQWHHNWNTFGNFMSQRHANQLRTCCHELYYINLNFLAGSRPSRNPPGSSLFFNSTTFAQDAKS